MEGNRTIDRTMAEPFDDEEPFDLVMLTDRLRILERLERVRGVSYLVGLMDGGPIAAYADSYARTVREKAVLPSTIGLSDRMMQEPYDGQAEKEVLDAARADPRMVAVGGGLDTVPDPMGIVTTAFRTIEGFLSINGWVCGVATGWSNVHRFLHGLQAGRLHIFAGRIGANRRLHGLEVGISVGPKESPS